MNQRDLLLVPFPFSDQSGKKVRPVVVISNSFFNNNSEDIIVLGITSNISKNKYAVNFSLDDLEDGHIEELCCIKVENILKIDKALIIKKIGKINKNKFKEIKLILDNILSEDN